MRGQNNLVNLTPAAKPGVGERVGLWPQNFSKNYNIIYQGTFPSSEDNSDNKDNLRRRLSLESFLLQKNTERTEKHRNFSSKRRITQIMRIRAGAGLNAPARCASEIS